MRLRLVVEAREDDLRVLRLQFNRLGLGHALVASRVTQSVTERTPRFEPTQDAWCESPRPNLVTETRAKHPSYIYLCPESEYVAFIDFKQEKTYSKMLGWAVGSLGAVARLPRRPLHSDPTVRSTIGRVRNAAIGLTNRVISHRPDSEPSGLVYTSPFIRGGAV